MTKWIKAAVWILVLTLAVSAFAGDKWVNFASSTNLNGQTIEPGEYKVKYSMNGSTADVQVLRGTQQVASATGQVVERNSAPSGNTMTFRNNGDGTKKLVEIQFAKQKKAIRFDGDSAAGK